MNSLIFLIQLQMLWTLNPTFASNPVMTHTSMDVGNIISVIIPESPDTTINVDQLTTDFRRQLERIHKQSRVTKFEHGLVTLKNILPEMSKEEKKKSIPLIRRVLQTRRMQPPKNTTRESQRRKVQRNKNSRRSPTKTTTSLNNRKNSNNANSSKSTNNNKYKRPVATAKVKPTQKILQKASTKQKPTKVARAYVIEENSKGNEKNDDFDEEYFIVKENDPQADRKGADDPQRVSRMDMNPPDRHSDIPPFTDADEILQVPRQFWDRDINRPNRRASQFPCYVGVDESKVRSAKDIHSDILGDKSNDCDRGIDANGQPISCRREGDPGGLDAPRVFNYPIQVEYSGYERIRQNPEASIDQVNSTGIDNGGESTSAKRKVQGASPEDINAEIDREEFPPEVKASEFYELNEKRQSLLIDEAQQAQYVGDTDVIPRAGRQFVDFDNKNFEIRIQRSVDNLIGTTMKPRYVSHQSEHADESSQQIKILKGWRGKKMKKPWKAYPRSLGKRLDSAKVK